MKVKRRKWIQTTEKRFNDSFISRNGDSAEQYHKTAQAVPHNLKVAVMKWGACLKIVIVVLILRPLPLKAAEGGSWIEIRSPHFTVFSDAGEKKARSVTHEFEKFHALIRQFLPSIQSGPSLSPVVIAAKNERTFRSLLPEFWEQKGSMRPSGIFVGGPEKNYIALRIDMDDDYRYHVVYHEYVHLLMRLNYPPLPTWLEEGLAECFGYTVISGESSNVGRASSLLLDILKNQQPLSIPELFAVDHESPYYREEMKSSIFYAQSWALTHMLLLDDKTARAQKLWKFMDLIRNNVPRNEAAVQAFGDLKELERRLNEYILQPSFYSFQVKTPSIQDPGEYMVRTVPFLEVRALQGDFFVSTQRWTEARKALDSVLSEDPQNPEALTSLGVYHARQNRTEESLKYFMAAAAAGSKSCLTYYYLGIAAVQTGEYQKAESNFRQAVALNSRFAPGYTALSGVLALNEENAETALKLAMQAVELEPGILSHQLNLANVLMHLKEFDLAIQYGEKIEAAAESARDREETKQFLLTARRFRDDYRTKEGTTEKRSNQHPEETTQDLEGIVSEIKCIDPPVMTVVIESEGGLHKFHISDYFDVQFRTVGYKSEGGLDPCADLVGRRVTLRFIATSDKIYAGEILSVDIYK